MDTAPHPNNTYGQVVAARADAEKKAWDSLGRYKFYMAGYWMAAWVKFNRLLPPDVRDPNPFKELVKLAREKTNGNASAM